MTKDNQCEQNTAGGLDEANISTMHYNLAASNSIFCFCEVCDGFFWWDFEGWCNIDVYLSWHLPLNTLIISI